MKPRLRETYPRIGIERRIQKKKKQGEYDEYCVATNSMQYAWADIRRSEPASVGKPRIQIVVLVEGFPFPNPFMDSADDDDDDDETND